MNQRESIMFITNDNRVYLGQNQPMLLTQIEHYLNRTLNKSEILDVYQQAMNWYHEHTNYEGGIPTLFVHQDILELTFEPLGLHSPTIIQGEQPVATFIQTKPYC